jgi:PHD/YefM family antitoxin component YafN of YafNO toxin-antitoxin module
MLQYNINNEQSEIIGLLEEVKKNNQPIYLNNKLNSAVIVSEENWRSIEETLYLINIPNMRESLIEGLNTPLDDCSDKLNW